jgi:hypothetical protein
VWGVRLAQDGKLALSCSPQVGTDSPRLSGLGVIPIGCPHNSTGREWIVQVMAGMIPTFRADFPLLPSKIYSLFSHITGIF